MTETTNQVEEYINQYLEKTPVEEIIRLAKTDIMTLGDTIGLPDVLCKKVYKPDEALADCANLVQDLDELVDLVREDMIEASKGNSTSVGVLGGDPLTPEGIKERCLVETSVLYVKMQYLRYVLTIAFGRLKRLMISGQHKKTNYAYPKSIIASGNEIITVKTNAPSKKKKRKKH